VISSLIANLATAYFQLRALDSELEISKRTLASRKSNVTPVAGLPLSGSGIVSTRVDELLLLGHIPVRSSSRGFRTALA